MAMLDLSQLKLDAKGLSILHAEDNSALRENASRLFGKFFDTVYTASDGKEGLQLFQKHNPDIVVTDIKMPNMSGIELAQAIRKISHRTKIIIMSAFDDKEYLYTAIEVGVFRFLKKPVNLSELTQILHDAVSDIKYENNLDLFNTQLQNVFNYQSSMVMMMKDSQPILANQMFLDFFDIKNIEEFTTKYGDFGNQLLENDGFLYNKADNYWLDELTSNTQKLHNIKLKNKNNEIKHFILKYQMLPKKDAYAVLSFDDVTELNLLKVFDEECSVADAIERDSQSLFKLLEVIRRNSVKVHLYNYYKGLSISNNATISDISKDKVFVKTNYLQQKAVQFEQRCLIVSESLPSPISCDTVVSMSFEKQYIEFTNLHFIHTSPTTRKTIRVVPEENHTISLFLGEHKFHGGIKIEDISLDAIKLELTTLPAGLKEGSEVTLDLVLSIDKKPLTINTKAVMLRKSEEKYSFSVVFNFKFAEGKKRELVRYITSRQMSIIREFKGLQNG